MKVDRVVELALLLSSRKLRNEEYESIEGSLSSNFSSLVESGEDQGKDKILYS